MKIWDEQAYADAYNYQGQPSYTRSHFVVNSDYGYIRETMLNLVGRNLLTPAQEILFVGCGFGWWMEYLIENVPGAVPDNYWGTEVSAYIHSNKNTESLYPAKILDLDLSAPDILDQLKPYFGGNGTVGGWVLSTQVPQ